MLLVDDARPDASRKSMAAEPRSTSICSMFEGFPVVLRNVADAVEVEIAEGRESPERHVVADAGALAGVEGEAGDVAQGFFQGVGVLVPIGASLTTVSAWGHPGQLGQLADAGDAALIALALVDAFIPER